MEYNSYNNDNPNPNAITRVSFSPQLPSNNSELVESIKQEALKSPTSFNLSTRNLMKIPSEIGLLNGLDRLGLNNNRLTTLPNEVVNLTALRYLNLKSNALKEFPAILTQLKSLEVLDMSRNQIKRFPLEFGNLISLRVLSVSYNEIRQLPKYFADMVQLDHFRLDHNPVTWPPMNVLFCESVNDQRAWLVSLKTFIRTNDPPPLTGRHSRTNSSLSDFSIIPSKIEEAPILDPISMETSTSRSLRRVPPASVKVDKLFNEEEKKIPISPVLIPLAAPLSSLKSCQELLHIFIAGYQEALEPLILKYPFIDAYLSILFGSVEIHAVAYYMTLVVGKFAEDLKEVDLTHLEMELRAVNHQSLLIIKLLKGFLVNNSVSAEQFDSLKETVASLVSETKSLVQACISSLLSILLNSEKTIDTRILNGLILDWKIANSSFQEATTLFAGGKKKLTLYQGASPSKIIPSSSSTSSPSDAYATLYTLLEAFEKKELSNIPGSVQKLTLKALQHCSTRDTMPFLETLAEFLAECKRIQKKSVVDSCHLIAVHANALVKMID